MEGKVAVVTGAGSGIGRATALVLGQSGARVAVADIDHESASVSVAELQDSGVMAVALYADVSKSGDVERMVEGVIDQWGRVDILVNNAGIADWAPALEIEEEDWDRILDVDLKGVFLCSQAVARRMVGQGEGGKIVNIASITGITPIETQAHYCAAKAGVISLTQVFALELAPHRINVNAVCPGVTRTNQTAGLLADECKRQEILAHIPMKRIGRPEDIAQAILFLSSPSSDYVTGTTIVVDGGWLMV